MLKDFVFSEKQCELHAERYRLFEENLTHHIFDEAFFDMTEIVKLKLLSNNQTSASEVYTGWNYDGQNKKCINANDISAFHPIFIRFFFDMASIRAYADVRIINNKTDEELEHDPIFLNINTRIINRISTTFTDIITNATYDFYGAIPSLLAHELTHIRDMFSDDYVNFMKNLKEFAHSQFDDDYVEFEQKYGFQFFSATNEHDKVFISLLLGLLGNSETHARIEAIDKTIANLPIEFLAETCGRFRSKWTVVNYLLTHYDNLLGSGVPHLSTAINRLNRQVQLFTKSDIRFWFVLTIFMIHYEFISQSDELKGVESFSILLDSDIALNESIMRKLKEARTLLIKTFNEYVTNIKATIADAIDDRKKADPKTFALYQLNEDTVFNFKHEYYSDEILDKIFENDGIENISEARRLALEFNNIQRIDSFNYRDEVFESGFIFNIDEPWTFKKRLF